MFVVVSYDVADDGRRRRVLKLMKNYGAHVQYSVFDCDIKEQTYKAMRARLAKLIKKQEDSVRFYFLDEDAVRKIQVLGNGDVQVAKEYYLIGGGSAGRQAARGG